MLESGGDQAGDSTSGGGTSGASYGAAAPRVESAVSAEAREGPDQARPVSPGSDEETRFREFVAERWASFLRTAYLLTGDHGHAEDLVQTALIRVHRHWGKVERSGSPDAYVRKVLVNAHTDWWRRFGSRERAERLTAEFEEVGSVDAYEAVELRDELWAALQALPPKMRAALVLRYFEDLGEAETAQILNCSIGTVKSQTSRGLQRLQQALSGQPPAEPSGMDEVPTSRSPAEPSPLPSAGLAPVIPRLDPR